MHDRTGRTPGLTFVNKWLLKTTVPALDATRANESLAKMVRRERSVPIPLRVRSLPKFKTLGLCAIAASNPLSLGGLWTRIQPRIGEKQFQTIAQSAAYGPIPMSGTIDSQNCVRSRTTPSKSPQALLLGQIPPYPSHHAFAIGDRSPPNTWHVPRSGRCNPSKCRRRRFGRPVEPQQTEHGSPSALSIENVLSDSVLPNRLTRLFTSTAFIASSAFALQWVRGGEIHWRQFLGIDTQNFREHDSIDRSPVQSTCLRCERRHASPNGRANVPRRPTRFDQTGLFQLAIRPPTCSDAASRPSPPAREWRATRRPRQRWPDKIRCLDLLDHLLYRRTPSSER